MLRNAFTWLIVLSAAEKSISRLYSVKKRTNQRGFDNRKE